MAVNLVDRLPDTYRKDADSNNYKLLRLQEQAFEAVEYDIADISDSLDITHAYGVTLDFYGEIYGQRRGTLDDDKYRILIQSAIENLLLDGSYKAVIDAICRVFRCEQSKIEIKDSENRPLEVKVVGLPIEAITRSGFSGSQVLRIIKRMLPVCVSISSDTVFEGTFTLGAQEGEMDATGLADDELTTGGTLSLIVGDGNDLILPL